jgi:hypothetical protein
VGVERGRASVGLLTQGRARGAAVYGRRGAGAAVGRAARPIRTAARARQPRTYACAHRRRNYTIHTYIPLTLYPEGVANTSTFYLNYLAVKNTADVTGGEPIAVIMQ